MCVCVFVVQVAVKVPSGLSTRTTDLVMNDLTREIQTMSRLDHPNIVKLYGITHSELPPPLSLPLSDVLYVCIYIWVVY